MLCNWKKVSSSRPLELLDATYNFHSWSRFVWCGSFISMRFYSHYTTVCCVHTTERMEIANKQQQKKKTKQTNLCITIKTSTLHMQTHVHSNARCWTHTQKDGERMRWWSSYIATCMYTVCIQINITITITDIIIDDFHFNWYFNVWPKCLHSLFGSVCGVSFSEGSICSSMYHLESRRPYELVWAKKMILFGLIFLHKNVRSTCAHRIAVECMGRRGRKGRNERT